MTVRELIEKLQQLDQDKLVVIKGYERGCDFPNRIAQVEVSLDVNTEWYYGRHELVFPISPDFKQENWNAYILETQ